MQLLFEMVPVVVAARRDIVRLFGKIERWRRIMPEICEEGRVIRAVRRDEHLLRLLQQPSSISRSNAARSPAGESGFPKFSCEITPFWQNAQRSVHPEKKTAPLP